jgi:hypothetical protein
MPPYCRVAKPDASFSGGGEVRRLQESSKGLFRYAGLFQDGLPPFNESLEVQFNGLPDVADGIFIGLPTRKTTRQRRNGYPVALLIRVRIVKLNGVSILPFQSTGHYHTGREVQS